MNDVPAIPLAVGGLRWTAAAGGQDHRRRDADQTEGVRRNKVPTIGVAFFDGADRFVGAVSTNSGDPLAAHGARPFELTGGGVDTTTIARAEGFAFIPWRPPNGDMKLPQRRVVVCVTRLSGWSADAFLTLPYAPDNYWRPYARRGACWRLHSHFRVSQGTGRAANPRGRTTHAGEEVEPRRSDRVTNRRSSADTHEGPPGGLDRSTAAFRAAVHLHAEQAKGIGVCGLRRRLQCLRD